MAKYLVYTKGYKPAKLVGYFTNNGKKMVRICWDNLPYRNYPLIEKTVDMRNVLKIVRVKSKFRKWLIKFFKKKKK